MDAKTEFLARSLVTAGVFLAIPATGAILLTALFLWTFVGTYSFTDLLIVFGLVLYCGFGFYLLARCIGYVRSPERPAPIWLWRAITLYILTMLVVGGICLTYAYIQTSHHEWRDWHGIELTPEWLVVPALFQLFSLYAFVLVVLLWWHHRTKIHNEQSA